MLSFLENWFPPLPADTAIALGAFISHRGELSPLGVFLATWLPNVAGAMTVWAASRQYGRRFFASSLGHRLFSERALHFVEVEYAKYGGAGLFIVKLLPGVRAMAAPFAGMANVSFLRALIPMTLASALWYGGVTWLGATLGAEWEHVQHWLGGLNRWLAVAGGAVVALVVIITLLRRRRAARAARADDASRDD